MICELFYRAYLETLNKPDGSAPDTYPEDDVRPALIAHFHLARLYDKYVLPENPQQKLRNKMQTYLCYTHVVEYCRKNPKAKEVGTHHMFSRILNFLFVIFFFLEKIVFSIRNNNEVYWHFMILILK